MPRSKKQFLPSGKNCGCMKWDRLNCSFPRKPQIWCTCPGAPVCISLAKDLPCLGWGCWISWAGRKIKSYQLYPWITSQFLRLAWLSNIYCSISSWLVSLCCFLIYFPVRIIVQSQVSWTGPDWCLLLNPGTVIFSCQIKYFPINYYSSDYA